MNNLRNQSNSKINLVSGMRPTGKLHLGHYLGVLQNWVDLQKSQKYNCYFMLADWHSLTTKYEDTGLIGKSIIEITRDFLACGLDPDESTIYIQSHVPEIAELHLLLSMITPNNWAERDPTLKDLVRASNQDETNLTYGMLGYPILQTSDILIFKGSAVPVGKDQTAHLEISREIARRFNYIFKKEFFADPKPLFTETPLIMGIDGTKMGKSFNNDIKISATEEETINSVKKMITDPQRIKRTDAGNTEECKVPFPYYKIFADADTCKTVKFECETAKRGCIDCKKQLADLINAKFATIRAKRQNFSDAEIIEILKAGSRKARQKAQDNLKQIRAIMKLNYFDKV